MRENVESATPQFEIRESLTPELRNQTAKTS